MLLRLNIKNLVLVESCEIVFEKGLNILTGETGAGKSALLEAIRLILGERADPSLIGKNGEIAVIEAILTNVFLPEDLEMPKPNHPLMIRREISKMGKNRCFANDQMISLSTLKQIVGHSIEIVDQSSSLLLNAVESQRKILDTYSGTLPIIEKLEQSYGLHQKLYAKKEAILQANQTRNRDLKWAEEDLQLIEEVNWKEHEEENLLEQHNLLSHSQELIEKLESLSSILSELPLKKAYLLLERCASLNPSLMPQAATLKGINVEIDEISRNILSSLSHLDADPNLLEKIEMRITEIEQIKRRFGRTFSDVEKKKIELQNKIDSLKNLDEELQELQSQIDKITEENLAMGLKIREIREKHAPEFTSSILDELKSLNLPHAQFVIDFKDSPLSSSGMDGIKFLFSANIGYPPIPISECASGGELSRLLFSFKVTISSKENNSCLIFDEIDSNVGGQTAAILGEKLKQISEKKQVICVTHFVQVARLAQTHFLVKKYEDEGKTIICKLKDEEKNLEYSRMLGGSLQKM